jgi:hypothetical protein
VRRVGLACFLQDAGNVLVAGAEPAAAAAVHKTRPRPR